MVALSYMSCVVCKQRKRHGEELASAHYQNIPYCVNEINPMILGKKDSSVLP